MKQPTIRQVKFHGEFAEKYTDEVLEIGADSMFNLFSILFKEIFPEFTKAEKLVTIAFEDGDGNITELFDPEQQLDPSQKIIHIMPNPDGAYGVVIAIVIAIIAVALAIMLAPKIEVDQRTASGANWESPENVIGQGGVIPVLLGTRLAGSRVASHGIDSTLYIGTAHDYA